MSRFVSIYEFESPTDCKWSGRFRNTIVSTLWQSWKEHGVTVLLGEEDEILGAVETDALLIEMASKYNWVVEDRNILTREENVYGVDKLFLGDLVYNVFYNKEVGSMQFDNSKRSSVFDKRSKVQNRN